MRCPICEKDELRRKKVEYNQFGISLGKFAALVCPTCNEAIFEGKTSGRIETLAKEKGVWGLAKKTTIGTSGSSLDVKIPKSIVDFLGLEKGREAIVEPLGKNKIEITLI
ncbi:MAG TPA: hypothetical protein VJG31_00725 [Candidatus Nanoarchaeia archaeon]|nr:hypothetical protein [Candidatus Nanoarchaeia archaeon]